MDLIEEYVKSGSGYAYQLLSNCYYVPLFCGSVAISLVTLRLYCRWTLGQCKCETTMAGKTVIVTGGNTGIGKSTAQELAKRGARIILACRNQERGQEAADAITAATGNSHVLYKPLDLCSFASVRKFADDFLATEKRLDVLINNAGVIGTPHRQTTVDECERTLQSNHLGHFLLTNLLLDILKESAPSRIVITSSSTYVNAKLNFNDLQSKIAYDTLDVYYKSKLANIFFARELAKKLRGTGVTANCVHPGVVRTELSKELTGVMLRITNFVLWLTGKTPKEGAQTTIHLALSRELENVSGNYYADCKQQRLKQHALDETAAAKLWMLSEKIISVSESTEK